MNLIIKGFILLFISSSVYGQSPFEETKGDSLSSKRVDQKTLHHYYQGEWKPLIQLGKKALKQDIDFKYLRYRMGIAHYELGHYSQALSQFKLVEKQSLTDTVLQEYQYYSYLFGGREEDARLFAEKMDPIVRKRVGFQKFRLINDVFISAGAKISNASDSVGHMPFVTVGMSHQLGTRFKYSHHFTFLTQNFSGLQYNQYEYYGKAEIALAKALQMVAAVHYTNLKGKASNMVQDSSMPFDLLIEEETTQTGLVALLGFGGDIGALRWKAYGSVGSWNNTTVGTPTPQTPFPLQGGPPPMTIQSRVTTIQYGVELDYKFEVNKNMWYSLGGHFAMQHQPSMGINRQQQQGQTSVASIEPIWGLRAYGQLTPKIGVGLNFMRANTSNFIANDGAYSVNTIGTLNAQVGASFNYQITPKWNWHINYTYENRKTDSFDFDYHILFTGLKFRL